MRTNPIQKALDFLVSGDPSELRAVAVRTTGDGTYTVKTYLNSVPQSEVSIGGKKELEGALASTTTLVTTRSTHAPEHHQEPEAESGTYEVSE